MKVLILNRRCIKHPQRGGAEAYTMELARAVLQTGGKVEWFSSRPKGTQSEEVIEGVKFVRRGNELTTHIYGFLYALKKSEDWIIFDEFNGIGYFTFFLKNSVLLIHQLYGEFWNAQFGFLGYFFRFLERLFLKLYRKRDTITVSASTYQDLKKLGFEKARIIHNCIDIKPLKDLPKKEEKLNLVYLGRLKRTKNPEDAVKAFLLIKEKVKETKLNIIGDGPLMSYLKEVYGKVPDITFWGYLDDRAKYRILERSHLLLVPSLREGWGRVVVEANAVGTPAIGYDVPGLRDSIKDKVTGFLVKDHVQMAQKAILLWENRELYKTMSENALRWARNFIQEITKEEFINFLRSRL